MLERSLEHVSDDFHVPVAVRAKAAPGLHAILIDHPQWTAKENVW
jgi:hypothetical protein